MARQATARFADGLSGWLRSALPGVVIEARHTCMTQRGVLATESDTVTSTMLGTLRHDPRSRAEFFALTGVSG